MKNIQLKDINEYKSKSINPSKTPDTVYEVYSVPSHANSKPEYLQGNGIGSNKAVVINGDVLICKINPRINRVWVVGNPSEYMSVASSEWIVVRNKAHNPEYLAWYFRSDKFKKLMNSGLTGIGGSLTRAQPKQVAKYPVPIRDRNEQDEIASALTKVDRIINCRRKQLEDLDALIKSRFVEMFGMPHERRFKTKTLPKIIASDKDALKRGPFGGSLKKDDFVSDGYLVYEQRHAIHNDFEYEKYYINEDKFNAMQTFKVVPGDLLVSCSGVTLGRIAEVPIYAKKGIINQALLKITLNQNVMRNKYFMELFRNEEIQNHLFGFSRGSGIPNFPSMNEVKEIEFLCPPIELQQKYCDFLRQVDKLRLSIQKSLNETQQLFDFLMQEYFG